MLGMHRRMDIGRARRYEQYSDTNKCEWHELRISAAIAKAAKQRSNRLSFIVVPSSHNIAQNSDLLNLALHHIAAL